MATYFSIEKLFTIDVIKLKMYNDLNNVCQVSYLCLHIV